MCAPAKLFEQIIYSHIYSHVEKSVVEEQHGFVAKKSINTNLFIFTNHGYETLEEKKQLDTIFTDFSKAFDKVDHDVLLGKLYKFGLSTNMMLLLKSYLQNRCFVVKHNGNTSGKYYANSGVPQGSNLGPLLFVLFINDLPSVVKFSKCLLFADDFKLYKKIQTIRDCVDLQKDIDNIYKWSCDFKLQFNIKKCSIITITRKKEPIVFDYKMDDARLKRTTSVKDLGVAYDCHLSFTVHMENISASANRMLGFIMRQTSTFTNVRTITTLYYAFVRTKLEFWPIA